MPLDDRIRQAAENILGNASLGEDLMDDEAQVLLDWGLDLSRLFVQRTGELDDNQALPILDEGLTALRRTMRRVSKLVGNLPHADPVTAEKQLGRVLEAADQLPGVALHAPADLGAEMEELRTLPPGQALERVLAWFSFGEEDRGAEESTHGPQER